MLMQATTIAQPAQILNGFLSPFKYLAHWYAEWRTERKWHKTLNSPEAERDADRALQSYSEGKGVEYREGTFAQYCPA
jgi:hypothetical protein